MKKLISTLLAACVLLSLAACGAAGTSPQADGTETYVFTDDLGREVTAPAHPERVAAMIGSFADVWCLAGGRDSLVAAADDAWTSFDLGLGADVTNLGAVKDEDRTPADYSGEYAFRSEEQLLAEGLIKTAVVEKSDLDF